MFVEDVRFKRKGFCSECVLAEHIQLLQSCVGNMIPPPLNCVRAFVKNGSHGLAGVYVCVLCH